MPCILQDYRQDKCAGCDGLCQHRIIVEGLTGSGGLVESAGIPKKYAGTTVQSTEVRKDKPELYSFVDKYVESLKEYVQGKREENDIPKSLYLYSNAAGTGKTTTAIAILNAYISIRYLTSLTKGNQPEHKTAYFLDVNELQTLYNEFNRPRVPEHIAEVASEEYYRRMRKAQESELVVMDDIGVRSPTEGFVGDLHTIINYRMKEDGITIYTSNIPMSDMRTMFTERFYDRVRDNTIELTFTGESFRGVKRGKGGDS